MKRQIRHGVFETNSSSVHSITMCTKNEFNEWILKNNDAIDFSNEIGDNINNELHFRENCDSGDHLHPSKYAYKLMGELAVKKIFNI